MGKNHSYLPRYVGPRASMPFWNIIFPAYTACCKKFCVKKSVPRRCNSPRSCAIVNGLGLKISQTSAQDSSNGVSIV